MTVPKRPTKVEVDAMVASQVSFCSRRLRPSLLAVCAER
jgi:hypothetical protein